MPKNQSTTPGSKRILIVDDERIALHVLDRHLKGLGYTVVCASSGREVLTILENGTVDLVITDLAMPEVDGIELMHLAKKQHPTLPFVVLTAAGSIASAVSAIREGALDYLEKPFNPETLDLVLQRALAFGRITEENAQLRAHFSERFSFHNIVTQSPVMRQALELAARVAASPKTTISITGESGVGKEVLARAVHFASGCLPGSFVALNCAAIPETLMESELFGHVRGAFTGADRNRVGKFTLARGGTLLLDEIGDMPLLLQAKLLRVIEERSYEEVGSNTQLSVDFRLIVATHRDLAELVRLGRFREDLFHRINVVPIALPPLRERSEDIPLLVEYYLDLFRRHQGKALPGVSQRAMDLLMAHSWPGNIRELRNVLEYAALMVSDELIRPEHLRLPNAKPLAAQPGRDTVDFQVSLSPEELSLVNLTNRILEMTLERCDGNKTQAAALLKVNRKMFYR
jgi:DNA-binding NtrC family response regulator